MNIESLINFIERQMVEGVNKETIRDALLKAGYLPIEIDEAFKAVEEGETVVASVVPPVLAPPKPKTLFQKVPWSKLVLVVLVLAIGASFYFYQKTSKLDPVSLLSEDTAFYLRVKISSQDKQVKQFKELLKRFPNYEKIAQYFAEEFEKLKEEEPHIKDLDLVISNEVILAYVSPFEKEMEELAFVLIFPNPDVKKLAKLSQDIESLVQENEDWEMQKETYKGRTITRIAPTKEAREEFSMEEVGFSTTFTNGHAVLAVRTEDIKKMIDIAEDQKFTGILKKDKLKSLNDNQAHKTLKKHFSGDYLACYYSEFNWAEILQTAGKIEGLKGIAKNPSSLLRTLIAGLPFSKAEQVKEAEKIAMALVIRAQENGLASESYALDLSNDRVLPAQFSLKDGLIQSFPAKLGNREIVFYGEARDLKKFFQEQLKMWTQELMPEEKQELDDVLDSLNEALGVDLGKDIVPLLDKNYAFYVAAEPSGEEMPRLGFIFEVESEDKVKEALMKIRIPKTALELEEGFGESQSRAKDARAIADIEQFRTVAEINYSQKGYFNLNCNYVSDARALCADIEEQVGSKPTIYSSKDSYCIYVKLNAPGAYYCVDSEFTNRKTYINPEQTSYCTGTTFLCPQQEGTAPPLPPEEKVGFSKEIVDGFEIYFLPVHAEFGLGFGIKDKKLVFAFTKQGVVDTLKGLSDSNQQKLKDQPLFSQQFKGVPESINSISYTYFYPSAGIVKYLFKLSINLMSSFYFSMMSSDTGLGMEMDFSGMIMPIVSEFLDKGIVPYLKVLKSGVSYSFMTKEGVIVTKSFLAIEELPAGEKEKCEDFWENIDKWWKEKQALLEEMFAPLMMMEGGTDMWGGSSFFQNNEKKAKEYIEQAISIMEEINIGQVGAETDVKKQDAASLIANAITLAEKATELDPGNAEIWFQRGNIYCELVGAAENVREWAINCYLQALDLDYTNIIYQEKLKECEAK